MGNRDTLLILDDAGNPERQARVQQQLVRQLGLSQAAPFTAADLTAGTESELAAAVTGRRASVDLPRALLASEHVASLSPPARAELAQWLGDNSDQAWEHSWLRIPRALLNRAARAQLERDLSGRADRTDFEIDSATVRLPASYVLKLALVDACHGLKLPPSLAAAAEQVAGCLLNDNTAPEIISTHIVSAGDGPLGQAVARENAQRFLLAQLLAAYANRQFGLAESNQTLSLYGAPNPPQRLKRLSRLLPGDYYRELFMNPCLTGFRDGAAKRDYMRLCHVTLSRSRQHARARLHGAGIGRAQVVERLVCDTSLLNNGTHLSLGSRALGAACDSPSGALAEKYLGDLASKIMEHFLPLFVGLYSAAPARLSAAELKPDRALGFLPNELTAPFLRLTWASWKRKAGLLSTLKGDFVPDARLLDYFAALPGTAAHAGQDGQLGNGERLKAALAAHGLYHPDMSVYALVRLRERARMGFSGFEARYYSLFASFADDLAPAAELQALVTALAYQYIANGEVTHATIPDDPESESERRQLFFALAAGLPVAYVRRTTCNRFLLRVLAHTLRTRPSKRHPHYYKIYLDDYRTALVQLLTDDAEPILDAAGRAALADLRLRLGQPDVRSAAGCLTRGILAELGEKNAMEVEAARFNQAAERYYRDTLRLRQLGEGIEACTGLLQANLQRVARQRLHFQLSALYGLTGGRSLDQFISMTRPSLQRETADPAALRAWIGLILANVAAAGAD